MRTILDVCREAKQHQNLSNRKLSEMSGVPLSTVSSVFRPDAISASIDTIAPICAALGVSIDDFYGILTDKEADTPDNSAEYVSQQLAVSEAERKSSNRQLTLMREIIDKQNHGIRMRDHIIIHTIIVLIALLVWVIYLDMHCLDYGFWRG